MLMEPTETDVMEPGEWYVILAGEPGGYLIGRHEPGKGDEERFPTFRVYPLHAKSYLLSVARKQVAAHLFIFRRERECPTCRCSTRAVVGE